MPTEINEKIFNKKIKDLEDKIKDLEIKNTKLELQNRQQTKINKMLETHIKILFNNDKALKAALSK